MSNSSINYGSEEKKGWFIWQLGGRLDRLTAGEALEKGEELLSGQAKFAMDLSRLEYLSSAGIRVLLKLAKVAEEKGIAFALISSGGMVREVLETSRLDMFVDICSSAEELDA